MLHGNLPTSRPRQETRFSWYLKWAPWLVVPNFRGTPFNFRGSPWTEVQLFDTWPNSSMIRLRVRFVGRQSLWNLQFLPGPHYLLAPMTPQSHFRCAPVSVDGLASTIRALPTVVPRQLELGCVNMRLVGGFTPGVLWSPSKSGKRNMNLFIHVHPDPSTDHNGHTSLVYGGCI